ncbi:TraB/GumN family protein [soil metagenome]
MERGARALAGMLAAALLTAAAPPKPVIDDPEAVIAKGLTEVSELVVRPDGPAWWMVTRGNSVVRILGVLWDFPPTEAWNRATLDRRVGRASKVILPPAFDGLPDPKTTPAGKRMPADPLPADLAARLRAAAIGMRADPKRYEGLDAITAGLTLVYDYRQHLGLAPETLVKSVVASAEKANRSTSLAGKVPYRPQFGDWTNTALEERLYCLAAALDEVEAGPEAVRGAIAGWTTGDVESALTMPRGLERCGFIIPGQAALRRQVIEIEVSAVKEALRSTDGTIRSAPRPREVVMVIGLRTLLAEDGVLDRLRKAGYTVEAG